MARLAIIAPGRGSYNRTELGYLKRFADHPRAGARQQIRETADSARTRLRRLSISALDDAAGYNPKLHLPGENASALIFSCAAADLALIDQDKHQITSVLGNSMGWYIALYAGGALDFNYAFQLIETMGHYQHDNIIGGQIIYPVIDDNWRPDPAQAAAVDRVLESIRARGEDHWVGLSIRLGGFLVLAGTDKGVKAMLAELPEVKLGANTYPFQLARHSAFHTHLMGETSRRATYDLNNLPFQQPTVPMIDGNGKIWRAGRSVSADLQTYTLENQVLEPYDFSASLRVTLREYNPDHLVLLGPGETLGGAIAHVIIEQGWKGIHSKADFLAAQKSDTPPLIAMNRPDQARLVI